MISRRFWLWPLLGALLTGCAGYEFHDNWFIEGARFREDPQKPLHDFHDLEPGGALMIILRDQVPGFNYGSGNILKLNFEIWNYEIGEAIDLQKGNIRVRFSDLQGIPPEAGDIGTFGKGTITIKKKGPGYLVLDCDIAIKMAAAGGGSYLAEIQDTFVCQLTSNNLEELGTYYGGRKE